MDLDQASDQTLLRQYVQQKSQAAFSQIMRRHYPLVYATCKREIEDTALAEDAAQVVFLLFAQRASSLRGGTGLAGWLFQTACFASKNAVRQERRRQQREQKGQEMLEKEMLEKELLEAEPLMDNQAPAAVWETIEPHLNSALGRLKPEDREAILLRFLEGCSLAEVGTRLEVSENTARMRITRALDKVRRHLAKQGVGVTIVLLTAILTEKANAIPRSVVPFNPTQGDPLSPFGQTTVRVHQLMQGVKTAMLLKTATVVAAAATACITAIAVPLLAFSAPNTAFKRHTARVVQEVPAPETKEETKVARITIMHRGSVPVPDAPILAVLSQKVSGPYDEAAAKQDAKAIQSLGTFNGTADVKAVADPKGGMDLTYTVTENPFVKTFKFTANTPDGLPSVPVADLKSHMEAKEGQVLNTAALTRDMTKLFNYQTGYMRSQGFIADLGGALSIDQMTSALTIDLVEDHIAQISIEGNRQVSTQEIMQQMHSKPGDVLNYHTLDADLDRISKTKMFDSVGPIAAKTDQNHQVTIVIPVVEKTASVAP